MTRDDILQDIAQSLKCSVENIPGDLSDQQLNPALGFAKGVAEVKRSRGDLPIPSYKVGRSRRTPLSAVIQFKLSQIQEQYQGVEASAA